MMQRQLKNIIGFKGSFGGMRSMMRSNRARYFSESLKEANKIGIIGTWTTR